MHDLAIALIIGVELVLLAARRRRARRGPALLLFQLYLVAAQTMAWLVMNDLASHEMLDLYGGPDQKNDLFLAIVAAAVLFLATRLLDPGDQGSDPTPAGAHGPVLLVATACATVWTALFLLAMSTLDLERLWATSHYLDLTDPDIMTRGAAPGLALGALPYAGAAAAAMAAALYATPRPGRWLAGLLLFQGAVTTLWLLAAHSRAAALAPATFAVLTLVWTGGRGARWRLSASGLAALVALAGALAGRNAGGHGLASLASLPGQIARTDQWLPRLAGNVTEGIFAVAAGLGEWRAAAPGAVSFPEAYRWLSFSPLPSAVDGFASVLDAQIRLHAFAPMPGYVELAWFGPAGLAVFIGLVAGASRMGAMATRASPPAGAAANLLLIACLYLMAAYPVRTALKPLWLALAVSAAALASACWRTPVPRPTGRQAHDVAHPIL